MQKQLFEMHVIVKGQVQGVGFRALTYHYATALNLKGSVSNLPNGSVEIYAQSDNKENLEKLIQLLEDSTKPNQIQDFSIRYQLINKLDDCFLILRRK